jgi:hypothetical protein
MQPQSIGNNVLGEEHERSLADLILLEGAEKNQILKPCLKARNIEF